VAVRLFTQISPVTPDGSTSIEKDERRFQRRCWQGLDPGLSRPLLGRTFSVSFGIEVTRDGRDRQILDRLEFS
jgi:hypothetical protein